MINLEPGQGAIEAVTGRVAVGDLWLAAGIVIAFKVASMALAIFMLRARGTERDRELRLLKT